MFRLTPLLALVLSTALVGCSEAPATVGASDDAVVGEYVIARKDWLAYRLGVYEALAKEVKSTTRRTPRELETIRRKELDPQRPLARLVVTPQLEGRFFQPTDYRTGPKESIWRFRRTTDGGWEVTKPGPNEERYAVHVDARGLVVRGLYATNESPGLTLRFWRVGSLAANDR